MTRVLLVDDHALIRRGMRDALASAGVEVLAEASGWEELEPLLGLPFDVLLLDIHMPGLSGLDILERIRAGAAREARVLVVSMYPEDPYALKALRAGAWGYVCKSADAPVLVEAIACVASGRRFVSPAIASLLAAQLSAPEAGAPHERLSPQEARLLGLIGGGLALAEIAQRLGLPPRTVSVYRARLLEKMKMASNAELAHYAARHGLVVPA